MIVYDAHAHAGDNAECEIRQRLGVKTLLSCSGKQEAAQGARLCSQTPVFSMTAGVHPWDADTVSLADMLPYMERCSLIGEIGLDSVWSPVPLAVQRRVFCAQLDFACANGKGIVLHTKGCEAEIVRMIEGFPHPILVHWYSGGQDVLQRFLVQGCYMSIGPDVAVNPFVQTAARLVPDNRILFETDGLDAVRWALGELSAQALPHVLACSVRAAAALRGQAPQKLAEYANGNFLRLF